MSVALPINRFYCGAMPHLTDCCRIDAHGAGAYRQPLQCDECCTCIGLCSVLHGKPLSHFALNEYVYIIMINNAQLDLCSVLCGLSIIHLIVICMNVTFVCV